MPPWGIVGIAWGALLFYCLLRDWRPSPMTGYMYVLGHCFGCGKLFTFNADLVPSIRVDGERQPVCEDCINRANPRRIANGLEPVKILPGAYEAGEA